MYKGNYALAADLLNHADQICPRHPTVLYNRGFCRQALSDHYGAIADQTVVIELIPNSVGAYYFRAVAKHSVKDIIGAIQDYSTAIKLNPKYHAAYLNRSLANYELGYPDQGLRDAEQADAVDPGVRETCRHNATTNLRSLETRLANGGVAALRPHHVFGLLYHLQDPSLFKLTDAAYVHDFRKRGSYHSEETAFVWRGVLQLICEHPKWKVVYCNGLDSVCQICPYHTRCGDEKTPHFAAAAKADADSVAKLPALRIGEVYSGEELRQCFIRNRWL
jgi:tetratricopeptide (TPR) repeat protein